MSTLRSSRELSERVEIDFPRRSRRPLRRRLALAALLAVFVTTAWIGSKWQSGQHSVFAAGRVSTAHRMIENDCGACHTTWAPLQRLGSWFDSDTIRSIDNTKCLACHDQALHHSNQVPGHGHDGLSCAECHREHRHHERLARVEDRQCLGCHDDLKTTSGPSSTFVRSLRAFDSAGEHAHPEFALKRLLLESSGGSRPGSAHGVWEVAEADESGGGFRDKARLRFNHAAHLKVENSSKGQLVVGLRNKDGRTVDFSKNCSSCHESDGSGGYMQPVQFERHCKSCHPLLFDNRNDAGRQVPHVTSDLVRGWLTERYTLAALEGSRTRSPEPGSDTPAGDSRRPFPGQAQRRSLDPSMARDVLGRVRAAEAVVQQHVHTLFGHEAKGGCRYCHEVSVAGSNWQVEPPGIPDRWMIHSRFRHGAHRLMRCEECHGDVASSRRTSDLLMPAIATCRGCHSVRPTATRLTRASEGARSDCVECHVYHGRSGRTSSAVSPSSGSADDVGSIGGR
mgnify:CR=1 FL=1